MFHAKYKKSFLTMRAIWFSEHREKELEKGCHIAYYRYMPNKPSLPFKEVTTLWTDLKGSPDDILSTMDKSVRYEIRRAQRDRIQTGFFDSAHLSGAPEIIEEFSWAYNHFLEAKNLPGRFNYNAVEAYKETGRFFVSLAKHNEQSCVYHGYVADGNIARLLYSVSLFRDADDPATRALIGRANRLLHFDDLLAFKGIGYSLYDWGGYSYGDEDVSNISRFKFGFGGKPMIVYDAIVPCSWLGKLALRVRK